MTGHWLRMLALAAGLTACDPGFELEGSVVDAAGRPVENVAVALRCYGSDQASTVTDSLGQFRLHKIGIFGDECAIDARPGDGRAMSFTIMRHCLKLHGIDKCGHVKLNVQLR